MAGLLLFLAREVHVDDVRAVVARSARGWGASFSGFLVLLVHVVGAVGLELQANSTAGSRKSVTAAKGTWSVDGTPPNDRPTLNESFSTFRSQKRCWMTIVISSGKRSVRCLGMLTPGHARLEGDVEMMVARKRAGPLDLAEHATDHVAQRLLHDLVVRDQAFGSLVAHHLSPW